MKHNCPLDNRKCDGCQAKFWCEEIPRLIEQEEAKFNKEG